MTDKALSNAELKRNQLLERKRQLRTEMELVDAQLAATELFIANWHEFANATAESPVAGITTLNENISGTRSTPTRKATRNSKKEDVAEAARQIIAERGQPVSRADLYPALTKRGLRIEGADPDMVLSTMLWRMRHRIVRLKTGGYWLRERKWEPAGYDPETATEVDNLLNRRAGEILDPESPEYQDASENAG